MRTTTIDVSGFRTPLDPLVIEKHLRGLKGVLDAAANFGSATATVRYDEARLSQAELEQAVRDCGFHCRGVVVPLHVCVPDIMRLAPGTAPQPVPTTWPRWGTAPAWTCRPWPGTCATAS